MQCIICHGEDIQLREVKEEVRIEANIVYVPMRMLVCSTCGERYDDRRAIRYLEEGEQQLTSGEGHLQEVGKVLLLT